MIRILSRCQKEIADFPEDIRGEIADVAARLEAGHLLSMPLSRPMPSIGKGVTSYGFAIVPVSIALFMLSFVREKFGFFMRFARRPRKLQNKIFRRRNYD